MRIGIDIRSLIFTQAGITNYTYNLIKALSEIDKENEYFLFSHAKSRYGWADCDNMTEKVLRFPHIGQITGKIWGNIILPRAIASMKVDIFHCPSFTLPSKKACRLIVTIHDLAFKKFPEFVTKSAFNYYNIYIQYAIDKADRLIADSHNTKRDIISLFNVDAGKIEVIYGATDESYHIIKNKKALEKVKEQYNLPEKFILFVGTVEPRKNLKRVIEAYHQLRKRRPTKHVLVIVGQKGWLYDDVFATVRKLKLEQDVIFTGYIPKSSLPLIYNSADLFVFPSLYEGFGLPVLEAMACGVPVVTSDTSSLPEVVGDAAILVDPYSVEAITAAMERVLEDKKLRGEMIERGIKQMHRFSWQDSARKTLMIYRNVLQKL